MSYEHAHLFREISYQLFKYSTKDIETLRSIVRNSNHEFPRHLLLRMKRHDLCDTIVVNMFGTDAVVEYKAFCADQDKVKQFVEGKLNASEAMKNSFA